ncbi:MAG TPA: hypothetical protein VGM56_33625 [Byssovorax sp.]|jgi:hypothetical protein
MRWNAVSAAALVCAVSGAALADAPGSASPADARFVEGRAAFDRGDYAIACAKFEESRALDPAAGTLLNLAVCEERIGRLVAARDHLITVQHELKPGDDRVAYARDLAAKLNARIPTLTIQLARGTPGDALVHDARDLGGATLPVDASMARDPGKQVLVLSALGHVDARVTVNLVEGQRAQVTLGVGPLISAAGAAAVPTTDGGRRARFIAGVALGGVGVAGFGVAAVTGVILLGKKSDLDKHCPNKGCDPQGLADLAADESTPLVPVNTASWIVGGVGVAAGAALMLTSWPRSRSSSSARVEPYVGPTSVGLRGAF